MAAIARISCVSLRAVIRICDCNHRVARDAHRRCADRLRRRPRITRHLTQNALPDTSDTVYFEGFDIDGELTMNDAMIAADTQEEHRTEAHDFVEMGKVSEETKGSLGGDWIDGGAGKWNVG